MIEYIDAETKRKAFVAVSRIVKIMEPPKGSQVGALIVLDTGECLCSWESADKMHKRFEDYQTTHMHSVR